MATASFISLDTAKRPVFAVPTLSAQAAASASEHLQKNHERHHIFFNDEGFHNHIAHHLPTIYALGAEPKEIRRQYDDNAGYQLPPKTLRKELVHDMNDDSIFRKYTGQAEHFHDYLVFFQDQIAAKGWQNVLNEWLFAGDAKANDMLTRLYGGLIHPFIHLGFGVEFEQPAIIAEALAETAIHEDRFASFLLSAEERSMKHDPSQTRSLMDLLNEIRANDTFSKCITEADSSGSKLQMVLSRLGDKLIDLVSQYKVSPEQLEAKMKEEYELAAYYTFASQRRDKAPKIDFFLMHDINAAIFLPRFMEATWLSTAAKCRILEWKGRLDLANYIARACPELRQEDITDYVPLSNVKSTSVEQQWQNIFRVANETEDDGHLPKLVRACAAGDQLWRSGEASGIITQDMWLKMAHMTIDSRLDSPKWIRSTGLDSAWKDVPSKEQRAKASL